VRSRSFSLAEAAIPVTRDPRSLGKPAELAYGVPLPVAEEAGFVTGAKRASGEDLSRDETVRT
jgi:hypothetical protein